MKPSFWGSLTASEDGVRNTNFGSGLAIATVCAMWTAAILVWRTMR